MSSWASLLCSLTQTVWNTVRPGCSLLRLSPTKLSYYEQYYLLRYFYQHLVEAQTKLFTYKVQISLFSIETRGGDDEFQKSATDKNDADFML